MVKGKVPVKSAAPNRKSTATASKSNGNTPGSASCQGPSKQSIQNVPVCSGCGSFITDGTKALQCHRCQSVHGWKCAECLNLSNSVYDALLSENGPPLRWFCDECDESWKRPGADDLMSAMPQLVNNLEQKLGSEITAMGTQLEGTEEKVELTSTTLNCKVDFLTNKVEGMMDSVMKTVATQAAVNEAQLVDITNVHDDTFHKRFDDKVDEILRSIECSAVEMNSARSKIQEDKEEEEEIQKRKTSVIIHGVSESADTSSDERQKYDNEEMENLLHKLGSDTVSVNKIIRLGKKPETSGAKPRPMKVVFASEEQKDAVLSKAKNVLRKGKEPRTGYLCIRI